MKYSDIDEKTKRQLKRDWVITNGIGGYCSQSALGCNTRKYHGLLVAPLTPPARRFLVLSKVDESIETDGKQYNLYTNIANGDISEGYEYLTDFKKEYIPIFTYKVAGITIKKFICMQYGRNTVVVLYRVINHDKETRLTLAPIVNFRDFHTTSTDHHFNAVQTHFSTKVKVILDNNSENPIYMYCSEGKYLRHINDEFINMYYPREEERGFTAEENHYVPGVYNINIAPNEKKDITFVCSLDENIEEIDGVNVINQEVTRLSEIIYDANILQDRKMNDEDIEVLKTLVMASDNFIVNRPSFNLHTIIAGYPWFLDWGRDSLISLEGLLLVTKRYNLAKEVILTNIQDIKFGLVPNGYSGYDNRPLYNSADSSLLLIEQVYKYLKYTNDSMFVEELYPILTRIMDAYSDRIDIDGDNIYLDTDNLISAGTTQTQITWMDAKIGDKVVTPRNGKTVELNALWYNALKIMARFAEMFNDKATCKKYLEMAQNTKESFIEKIIPRFKTLSSGHKVILLIIVRLIELVEEKTLVIMDEPEEHLHPPLVSALIRALSSLLTYRNGVGVIATHSPVIVQEVPKDCVWILRRVGEELIAERPEIETFGENLGVLTSEIFGYEVTNSGFHTMIQNSVEKYSSFKRAMNYFHGKLGNEGKAILRSLMYEKEQLEEEVDD